MSIASSTWLRAKPAADRLGVTVYTLHTMALSGAVRHMTEKGQLPRFNAEDIDRILAEKGEPAAAAS
jgi:predicted site-specific integrase-resolvase